MAVWEHRLRARVRDGIAAYYARYPDATPDEIEAWLTDRGFAVTRGDIEEFMAALESEPNWRTGWVNRHISWGSGDFDPDQFLLFGEDAGKEQAPAGAAVAEEELADVEDMADEAVESEEDDEDWSEEEGSDVALAPSAGGADWLPGMALAAAVLVVSGGIVALIFAVLR